MFFIAYAFKGQVNVFARRVKIVSHSFCNTSAILKYFCPLAENTYRLFCLYGIELVLALSSTVDIAKGTWVCDISRYEWYSMNQMSVIYSLQ